MPVRLNQPFGGRRRLRAAGTGTRGLKARAAELAGRVRVRKMTAEEKQRFGIEEEE